MYDCILWTGESWLLEQELQFHFRTAQAYLFTEREFQRGHKKSHDSKISFAAIHSIFKVDLYLLLLNNENTQEIIIM
jgi:hypothetical protein